MNVLVLNGSPAGENSITLQTVRYIELFYPEHTFTVLHVGQRIRSFEKDFSACAGALEAADLVLFCYPVYTFLAPSQLHRFIELMKERGPALAGKAAAQLTTSKHFYDTTAHRYIRDNCRDLGLSWAGGLSADMEDLLAEQGREDALAFFRHALWRMETGTFPQEAVPAGPVREPMPVSPAPESAEKTPVLIAVVADLSGDTGDRLRAMIGRFTARCSRDVRVVDIGKFPFGGGCLGCFRCAADGTCIYKDGFDRLLREEIQTAEATVYAFPIRDHAMGSRFKTFDDRQFCNGHRTVTMGKPVGYLVAGDLEAEENLRLLLEGRAQVGGNYLAGFAWDTRDPDAGIDALARELDHALDAGYLPPRDFLGVGGMKIFRDLIYTMQGLMREDHRFYKKHGFYKDFPQRHRGKIMAMYLVGAMMNSKSLSKKAGNFMTEGMLLPYNKVLEQARRRAEADSPASPSEQNTAQ